MVEAPKPRTTRKPRAATPAAAAREAANLTVEQAAKKAGISAAYLKHVERKGACYKLARRLSGIYECGLDVFLPSLWKGESAAVAPRKYNAREDEED